MSKDGKQPYPLIQSYLMGKWMVSTAYRQSSATTESPPWYFETIVWAWDSEKRERGEMLHMDDSGSEPISALGKHNYICLSLLTGRPLED